MTGSRIEYRGTRAGARALSDAVKGGLTDAVEYWHKTLMPGHFTPAGAQKYGYQKRSGEGEPAWVPSKRGIVLHGGRTKYGSQRVKQNRKYFWRKQREKGTTDPLVYSGASERAAKASVRLTSRRRSTGLFEAAAAMSLPKYFYQYRKDLNQPNKADELTRVTPDEVQVLEGIAAKGTADRLNARAAAGRVQRVNT